MNIQTIMLIAMLLCGESIHGTFLERFLMAETIVYRAEVSGMTIEEVVWAPAQYAGAGKLTLEECQLYRPHELEENIQIAIMVLAAPSVMRISNFARTGSCWYGRPCEWESKCEKIIEEGAHTFFLCPLWK